MKKIICLVLALTLAAFCFVSCGEKVENNENNEKVDENTVDSELEINVTVLSGTTGMGAAKMIVDGVDGLNCKFTVVTERMIDDSIKAGIINGAVDIAAVPTNLAPALYKLTNGGIQVLAVNTLGVLYLLENGKSINSIADLKGKTVYVPGQGKNPEYILKYILEQNGLSVGEDVNFYYSDAENIGSLIAKGDCDVALLPEPKVTSVISKNADVRIALDVTEEFDKVSTAGSLVQGCIIARSEFIENHPAETAAFLKEYKKSIEYTLEDPNGAAEKIAAAGIIPEAPLALKALPNCNIVYIDGENMKTALDNFYSILYSVEPKSIGGAIPDAGIYYLP